MRRMAWIGWALLLLLAPGAAAVPVDALSWSSAEPLALAGALGVEAPGGVAQVDDARADGVLEMELGNGTITVSSWRRARLDVPPRLGEYGVPMEASRTERFEVRGTRLVVRLDAEPLKLTLVAGEGGVLRAEGAGATEGLPVRLAHRLEGYPVDGPLTDNASPLTPPPRVAWAWEAGWLFCGAYPGAPDPGFPILSGPTLRARGPAQLLVVGGTATFLDANGTLHEVQLGNSPDPDAPASPGAGVQRSARLLFHGEVRDARIPASGTWGLAGPEVRWTVLGSVTSARATGEYRDAEGTHAFTDEALRAEGNLTLAPQPRGPGLAPSESYLATGRFDALVVGSAPVAPPPAASLAAPAAGVTLAGLLLLLLAKAGREAAAKLAAPLYTRLSPDNVLDHEARRRLHDLALREPGIHLRELGRRAGLSWGTLRFHVGMLRKAGLLQLHRRGGHLHAYPSGVGPGLVSPVPHPLAQRILAALPPDGAALDLRRLQEQVGASRQLLSYHLKRLEAEGRVHVSGPRPTLVARAVPGPVSSA